MDSPDVATPRPDEHSTMTSFKSSDLPLLTTLSSHEKPPTLSTISTGSEPPSPVIGFPLNFGIVEEGAIYRSSFPKTGNFDHLASLNLRTVLTLVDLSYPAENVAFLEQNGIRHFQIQIPPHKNTFDSIPIHAMTRALEIVTDKANHPILIHCNKGKHRTGCVVGCYRKLLGWSHKDIIAEYDLYAAHKARDFDKRYIEVFDDQAMQGTLEIQSIRPMTKYSPDSAGKERMMNGCAKKDLLGAPATNGVGDNAEGERCNGVS